MRSFFPLVFTYIKYILSFLASWYALEYKINVRFDYIISLEGLRVWPNSCSVSWGGVVSFLLPNCSRRNNTVPFNRRYSCWKLSFWWENTDRSCSDTCLCCSCCIWQQSLTRGIEGWKMRDLFDSCIPFQIGNLDDWLIARNRSGAQLCCWIMQSLHWVVIYSHVALIEVHPFKSFLVLHSIIFRFWNYLRQMREQSLFKRLYF